MRQSLSCLHAEIGIVPVPLGDDGHLQRQPDAEERVVPSKPPRAFLRIEFGHLIEDFGVVLQCDETVPESLRDVEHFPVFRGERHRQVFLEGGRIRAQVDDDIAYGTHGAPHQFRFLMGRRLVMHAAEGAFLEVERDIALDQARVESVLPEFPLTPRAGKEAAVILVRLGVDDIGAAQTCFFEDQGSPLRSVQAYAPVHSRLPSSIPFSRSRLSTSSRIYLELLKFGSLKPIASRPSLSSAMAVSRSTCGWCLGARRSYREKSTRYERLSGGAFLFIEMLTRGTTFATASANSFTW